MLLQQRQADGADIGADVPQHAMVMAFDLAAQRIRYQRGMVLPDGERKFIQIVPLHQPGSAAPIDPDRPNAARPGDQTDQSGVYRIERSGDELILMQRSHHDSGKPQYRFMLQTYEYADYAEMCLYHQTSPQSPFTRGQVCTLATLEGRITLRNMRLITTLQGEKHERVIEDQEEHRSVLRELFGIELGSNKLL